MAEGARLEIVLPLIAVPGFKSPSLRHKSTRIWIQSPSAFLYFLQESNAKRQMHLVLLARCFFYRFAVWGFVQGLGAKHFFQSPSYAKKSIDKHDFCYD